MIDYELIGTRIKEKRKIKKITQETLAEKLHVSVGYISQLERGTTKINLETLSKIALETDTDISYFINGTYSQHNGYAVKEFDEMISLLSANEREVLLNQLKSYIEFKKQAK